MPVKKKIPHMRSDVSVQFLMETNIERLIYIDIENLLKMALLTLFVNPALDSSSAPPCLNHCWQCVLSISYGGIFHTFIFLCVVQLERLYAENEGRMAELTAEFVAEKNDLLRAHKSKVFRLFLSSFYPWFRLLFFFFFSFCCKISLVILHSLLLFKGESSGYS